MIGRVCVLVKLVSSLGSSFVNIRPLAQSKLLTYTGHIVAVTRLNFASNQSVPLRFPSIHNGGCRTLSQSGIDIIIIIIIM